MLGLPTHRIRCAVCSYGSSGRCPREGRVDTTSARVKRVGASISAFAGASPPSLPRLGSFSSRRDGARVGLCSRPSRSHLTRLASARSPRAAHSFSSSLASSSSRPLRSPFFPWHGWILAGRTCPKNGVRAGNTLVYVTARSVAKSSAFCNFFLVFHVDWHLVVGCSA